MNMLSAVRARLADTLAPMASDERLGAFMLRVDQREAVARLVRAVHRHGGALLADPPGAGKTVTALAVAIAMRQPPAALGDPSTVVLAPAALREQWHATALRAACPIRFVSMESISHGGGIPTAPFYIVDEAHRLGRPTTKRYRAVAQCALRTPTLLLTATPVVNRASDRDALLGLFLGPQAVNDPAVVREVIVRRETTTNALPKRRGLAPLDVAHVPFDLASALKELPPPFPVADGVAATALVRTTLAMAWRSSLAALDAALRRRASRGQSLGEALARGEWPTRQQLREWIGDGDLEQLALPLVSWTVTLAPADALPVVRQHVAAVHALRVQLAPIVPHDTMVRAHALLRLSAQHPDERIVVFAQHAETIHALWRELWGTPGVVAITGQRVLAAAGRWTREEVFVQLGPQAGPYRPDDVRGIRMLLTTDLLAEGVELPGASVAVHADMPWTPARLEQREGRLRRPGNPREVVGVTGYPSPPGIAPLIMLGALLRRKRAARDRALSAARQHAQTAERVAAWRDDSAPTATPPHGTVAEPVAAVAASRPGFVAVYALGGASHVCTGVLRHGAWVVGDDSAVLDRLLSTTTGGAVAPDSALVTSAMSACYHYLETRHGRALLGAVDGTGRVMARLRRQLDTAVRHTPLLARASMAQRASEALLRVQRVQSVGALRAVRTLLRTTPPAERIAALEALVQLWRSAPNDRGEHPRVESILLFQASNAPPDARIAAGRC